MSDSLFRHSGAAPELPSRRTGLNTSNIANAATQGYKATDIVFAAALTAQRTGGDTDRAASVGTLYRVSTMPSLDGNTVESPTKQFVFAANAVGYMSTLSFTNNSVARSRAF